MTPFAPDLDNASVGKRCGHAWHAGIGRFLMGNGFFMDIMQSALTDDETERYCRNIRLKGFGVAGQMRLRSARVLIVGLGGLGSPALFYLAAAGVGHIGIVDGDRVEPSNLQRQILHGDLDVGRSKTTSAVETIRRRYGHVQLTPYDYRLTETNIAETLAPYDFVVEATDNFESKFLLNDACVRLGRPYSHAAVSGYYGQTMTVVPGKGPCYRCVFGEVPSSGAVKGPEEEGILGTVPGVIGTIQATEVIKHILGVGQLLVGRLLTWDAWTQSFREVLLPPKPSCTVCQAVAAPYSAG
jgi:molybdopterin-synthase adenylyltransferase